MERILRIESEDDLLTDDRLLHRIRKSAFADAAWIKGRRKLESS